MMAGAAHISQPQGEGNRNRILDAADGVFADVGVTAPLDLVKSRAGVGRATLYRYFADRQALIVALADRALSKLEAVAEQGIDASTLERLLTDAADIIAASPAIADFWRVMDDDDPAVNVLRERNAALFARPLQLAIDDGSCRNDMNLADIMLLIGMLGACLRGRGLAERQALARRGLQLALDGSRRPGRS